MRDLRLVPGANRGRRVRRGQPILAFAAVLLLATATGLVAVGSRDTTPNPNLADAVPTTLIASPDPAPLLPSATGWLVFSSNGSLFVTRGDGSERRQLTDGSVADYFPVWSPDGERIAFFSQNCVASETCPEKVAGSDLVVIDSDGTNRRVLRPGLPNPVSPRWISDGSAIVATALDGAGEPSIELVGLDGSVGPAGQHPIDPAFVSPDGREVIRLDEQMRIHISNMDGSNDRLLLVDPIGRGSLVGWSPDGLAIAYIVAPRSLAPTTWRVNRDGSEAQPWPGLPEHGTLLGWSPNGQWMLILVRGDGQQPTNQFIVAAPDGSNPRLLPSVDGLTWSSDGRWLLGDRSAVLSGPGLPGTIVVVDPEGRIDPVEFVAPGLLGMSWRPGAASVVEPGKAIATSPTPRASLAEDTLRPIVEVPSGLVSVRTVGEVEKIAGELIQAGQLGIASRPTRITRVTLVAAGATYSFASDGAQTLDFQSWIVEVQGTVVSCAFSCERWQNPTLVLDDRDGSESFWGESDGTQMPSKSFRQVLADHGLVYTPTTAPSVGIVAADDIVTRLDHSVFWMNYAITGPLYGLISVASPDLASARVMTLTPNGNGTKAIWWVGARDQVLPEKAPWAVFDPSSGGLLMARPRG